MGRRGPQPAPAKLKILGGTGPGRDSGGRVVKAPPPFERGAPPMPDWLGGAARELWENVVPRLEQLDLLKEDDGPSLVSYCVCYQVIVEASAILAAEGYTVATADGRPIAHPLVAVRARAISDMRPLAAAFGLTPSSESNLSAPPVPVDIDDPFAAPSSYGT